MDESIRMEPITLSAMEGSHRYCIFAKIQEGMNPTGFLTQKMGAQKLRIFTDKKYARNLVKFSGH